MTQDYRLKKLLFSVLLITLGFGAESCTEDDVNEVPDPIVIPDPDPLDPDPDPAPTPTPLDSTTFQITFTSVRDAYEEGKASDLIVSFNAPTSDSVTSIRLFGVLISDVDEVDYLSLSSLTNDQFIELQNDEKGYDIQLTNALTDFKRNPYYTDTSYVFYAITYGIYLGETQEILSGPSTQVAIVEQLAVSTLVPDYVANDALTLDDEGNIYGAEFAGGVGTRIIKTSKTGASSTFVDGLSGPLGIVFDKDGNFYICNNNDLSSRKIIKVTPDGNKTDLAIIPGYPAGLIVDKNGNILVSNWSSPTIHMVTPTGDTSLYMNDPALRGGVGMAYDDDDNLIVGNYRNGNILSISPEKVMENIASIEVVRADNVIGYLTYLNGFIYATGIFSHKVYKVSLNGQVETFAGTGISGSFDAPLLEAKFSQCNGIAADKINNILYVSHASNNALRKIQLD